MSGTTCATLVAGGGATLVAATALMRAGVEPFATWYYPFAWYSTLLMAEAAVARRDGRFFFLDRPGFALSLFGWSIPFWLFFELLNFRLANWYYVFVPDQPVARWTGIAISFATVLPAIFVAERVLRSYGPWREISEPAAAEPAAAVDGARAPGRPPRTARSLHVLQLLGLACLLLPLVWPRWLFPLVWIGVTLVADPWVYRHDPARSLLADLEGGRPRRPVRLLVGGMAIGFLWELFNAGARGKWIYTVPGLEELKLFEMPLLGFFGFPFLALEGWATYQALVVAGVAVDPNRPRAVDGDETDDHPGDQSATPADPGGPVRRSFRRGWIVPVATLATVFSGLALRGMEIGTISSRTPRLEAIETPAARALRAAGYDVFALAGARSEAVVRESGVDPPEAQAWIEWARLVTLRGIGTVNADRLRGAGVVSVRDLASARPAELSERLAQEGASILPARVRVWVRAARQAVGAESQSKPSTRS